MAALVRVVNLSENPMFTGSVPGHGGTHAYHLIGKTLVNTELMHRFTRNLLVWDMPGSLAGGGAVNRSRHFYTC